MQNEREYHGGKSIVQGNFVLRGTTLWQSTFKVQTKDVKWLILGMNNNVEELHV